MNFVFVGLVALLLHASAFADDVPLVATHLMLGKDGLPTQLIFDPAGFGSGLTIEVDGFPIPADCKFGPRDATAATPAMHRAIRDAQAAAESEVGGRVERVAVCSATDDWFSFPTGRGSSRIQWKSLWGETRDIQMWSASTPSTLVFFSFGAAK